MSLFISIVMFVGLVFMLAGIALTVWTQRRLGEARALLEQLMAAEESLCGCDMRYDPAFVDSARYASLALTVGHDPDRPGLVAARAFKLTPPPSVTDQETLSAGDVADALRCVADDIEELGGEL
jgi:hypothetical protein